MLNTIHHPGADVVLPVAGCVLASSARADLPPARPRARAALDNPALPPAASASLATTETTRAVVQRFIDLLYRRRQVRAAFECCVVAQGYRDHAWHGRGSRAGVMRALARHMADTALNAELQHLVVDGDLAMAHLHCRSGEAAPSARVEIYRVADGRIAEHWSVCAMPISTTPAFTTPVCTTLACTTPPPPAPTWTPTAP